MNQVRATDPTLRVSAALPQAAQDHNCRHGAAIRRQAISGAIPPQPMHPTNCSDLTTPQL